jgi:hypothetical protein
MQLLRSAIVRAAQEVRPADVFDRLAQSGTSYGLTSLQFGRTNLYRLGRGYAVIINKTARGVGMTRGSAIRDAAISAGIDINAAIDEGIAQRATDP